MHCVTVMSFSAQCQSVMSLRGLTARHICCSATETMDHQCYKPVQSDRPATEDMSFQLIFYITEAISDSDILVSEGANEMES